MPVFLGLDLLDWALAGGVAYAATSAVGSVAQGVDTGIQTATSNVTQTALTVAMIGGVVLLVFTVLRK